MAMRTQPHEPAVPLDAERKKGHAKMGLWPRVKLVISRAIFWSYERGSWQYDIIVAVILAFIFLTPASWFHDRPHLQLTDLRHVQGIVEVGHSDRVWVYQLDARLVDSLEPLSPLDAAKQLLLHRIRPPFTVKSFDPIRGKDGVILGYTVKIER
jgi:hypothetical protein